MIHLLPLSRSLLLNHETTITTSFISLSSPHINKIVMKQNPSQQNLNSTIINRNQTNMRHESVKESLIQSIGIKSINNRLKGENVTVGAAVMWLCRSSRTGPVGGSGGSDDDDGGDPRRCLMRSSGWIKGFVQQTVS